MRRLSVIIVAIIVISGCCRKRFDTQIVEHHLSFEINDTFPDAIVTRTVAKIEYLEQKHDQELKPAFKEELSAAIDTVVREVVEEVPILADTASFTFDEKNATGVVTVWQTEGGALDFKMDIECKCRDPGLFQKMKDLWFIWLIFLAVIAGIVILFLTKK